MTQLRELAEPFKGKLVKDPPKGKFGEYVSHSTVNERALSVVGPHSFEVIDLIRSEQGLLTGCLGRLTVEIDGRHVVVTEVGDVEHPEKANDGANAKNASSDAYKRCWMRLGLGLHLWSQEDYFLDKQLDKNAQEEVDTVIADTLNGLGQVTNRRVLSRIDAETGEAVFDPIIEGQETLLAGDDDPERPFE